MAAKKSTKKTSTRALTGNRLMHRDVPSTAATYNAGTNTWDVTNGWRVGPTVRAVYHESYFDLSGYELDDLTTVPTVLMLQDSGQYFLSNPFADSLVTVLDIISEERLDPDTISTLSMTGDYPGTPGSTENYEQIKMCNVRGMTTQTEFGSITLLRPAFGGAYGSSSPTAVQKLWCYRVIRIAATDLTGQVLFVPATRFVMGATIVQEKELPYMMRLKRSYELSTQG
jgi:hypothetical protein